MNVNTMVFDSLLRLERFVFSGRNRGVADLGIDGSVIVLLNKLGIFLISVFDQEVYFHLRVCMSTC